jgi:HEAT repeat protein
MDFEQQLRAAFAPCAARPGLRSRILARKSALQGSHTEKGRTGNRIILVSSIIAVAAAAAMLTMHETNEPRGQTLILEQTQTATPTAEIPTITSEAETPDLPQSVGVVTAPSPHFLVRVLRRDLEAGPGGNQAIDSLRDTLIEQLRAVPGLVLVESDLTKEKTSPRYQLSLLGVVEAGPDGRPVQKKNRYVPVGMVAAQVQSNGQSVNRLYYGDSVDLLAPCAGAAPSADTPCKDLRGAVATMVRKLQEEVFPPDPAVTRGLQAKLRDTSLDAAQRIKALFDLLKIRDNIEERGVLGNPLVVRAVIDLAASADPALRARIWRVMRGVGSRELIQPLMDSVSNEPVDVRLAALEVLSDFREDPRVRSTLESIALGDSRPLVRAVAERTLSGEEPWKRYVANSLKDSSRSAAERAEALVYYLYPPGPSKYAFSHPDYSKVMKDVLDDEAVTALATAFPDAGSLNGSAVSLLGGFAPKYPKNPAVTQMLLTIVQTDKRSDMRSLAGEVLASMHASEPPVRAVLNQVIQNDPDPSVRKTVQERMPAAREAPPF